MYTHLSTFEVDLRPPLCVYGFPDQISTESLVSKHPKGNILFKDFKFWFLLSENLSLNRLSNYSRILGVSSPPIYLSGPQLIQQQLFWRFTFPESL